jgi:peptide deformylase
MIRKIVTLPSSVLREKSVRIGHIDESIRQLAQDMIETTLDWDRKNEFGAALAAVQVGQKQKLTVVRNNFEDAEDDEFLTFVNPEIIQQSSHRVSDVEGCLSIPRYYARIPRSNKIKVKAETIDGEPIRLSLEGFAARVFQHEIDHMHGKLFLDYVRDPADLLFLGDDNQLHPVDVIPDDIQKFIDDRR